MKKVVNQSGLVSLMVTMVLMMVISLIVLGFAQMSRRESRQALDRSLSTQAFLAAETGVNDARQAIRAALATGATVPDKTECRRASGASPYAPFDPVLDAGGDVSYSCLLVSTLLQDIVQMVAADGSAATIPLHPVNGNIIGRLHLKWSLPERPSETDLDLCLDEVPGGGIDSFPKAADWQCPYGVLRLDLVPTDNLKREQLIANNRVAFIYPVRGEGTASKDYADLNGVVTPMNCTVDACSMDITGMDTFSQYSLRASGIYSGASLEITAENAFGKSLLLADAQALIDVTGRANGVLRRIQARSSLVNGSSTSAAIQSGSSICKRFGITPDEFRVPGDIIGQDTNNPLCRPQSAGTP
ncbi:MAG TPA: pilus assembly PilX N-terminal domain-containing protein [Candidatus Saccharimonadales bacterium]|nr:pilus assembly PilX N-terminal domain-containing protein [Candidatus Saccharimonadales bacterium]